MAENIILEGFRNALELIISGDPVVFDIALRSIQVSGIATLLAILWSVPVGVILGMYAFPGKRIIKGIFNGFTGIPTVVLGLLLYLLLVPMGPFGSLGLLYTTLGISIGQSLLITPIIVSFTTSAVESLDTNVRELAITLGAGRLEASAAVLQEALNGIILSVTTGFNRAIAELGIASLVGGNILVAGGALNTRVLTTTIQMETTRNNLDMAIALGIILLVIVFSVSVLSNYFQRRTP